MKTRHLAATNPNRHASKALRWIVTPGVLAQQFGSSRRPGSAAPPHRLPRPQLLPAARFGHPRCDGLGEDLRLLPLELVGCDDAPVTQCDELGQLVGRAL